MSGVDIGPIKPPRVSKLERGHAFEHQLTRKRELLLQQEVEEMAKFTMTELHVQKQRELSTPISAKERTTRTLLPNFKPIRIREKRKSHPIFHEDLLDPKKSRPKSPKTVWPYNSLDREGREIQLTDEPRKTKKFPFTKDRIITIEAMKEPHVSSVGVVPVRDCLAIKELNVLIEGKPAMKTEADPVIGPIQRANTVPKERSESPVYDTDNFDPVLNSYESAPKPAIVVSRGTLCQKPIIKRPPPVPKQRSYQNPSKFDRSHVSTTDSSATLTEYELLGDDDTSHSRQGSARSQKSHVSSTKTVCTKVKVYLG